MGHGLQVRHIPLNLAYSSLLYMSMTCGLSDVCSGNKAMLGKTGPIHTGHRVSALEGTRPWGLCLLESAVPHTVITLQVPLAEEEGLKEVTQRHNPL